MFKQIFTYIFKLKDKLKDKAGFNYSDNFSTKNLPKLDVHIDSQKLIKEDAYFLWINAGKPENRSLDFWLQAEKKYARPK